MKRRGIGILIAGIVMSMLVGCGNSDTSSTPKAEASETEQETPDSATAEADDTSAETEEDAETSEESETEQEEENADASGPWGARSFEEFVEYVRSDAVSEQGHEYEEYVSGYSGDYETEKENDSGTIIIKDSRARDNYYDSDSGSYQELAELIDDNAFLDDQQKEFFKDYVKTMIDFYPNMDTRLLYYNLDNIEVEIAESGVLDENTYGRFLSRTHEILIRDNTELTDDSEAAVVMRHELGHAATICYGFKRTGEMNFVDFQDRLAYDYGHITEESLDTIFTLDPFLNRYSEETRSMGMGYIITSNLYRALFKLVPDVRIENIFKNDIYYFEEYLDEHFDGDITSSEWIDLIDKVSETANAEEYEAEAEHYKTLVKYVADNYIALALTDELSEDEVLAIRDALKFRLCSRMEGDESEAIQICYDTLPYVDECFDAYLAGR